MLKTKGPGTEEVAVMLDTRDPLEVADDACQGGMDWLCRFLEGREGEGLSALGQTSTISGRKT